DGKGLPLDRQTGRRLAHAGHHERVALAEAGQRPRLRAHVADLERALLRQCWPGYDPTDREGRPGRCDLEEFAPAHQNCTGAGGILPEAYRAGSSGEAFSHTSSIERLGEKPRWGMAAGMAGTSPARMVTRARNAPVSRSSTSHWISSLSCTNPSTRSLPWMMGRMYSSVVGQ